jgi:hypothetical protein
MTDFLTAMQGQMTTMFATIPNLVTSTIEAGVMKSHDPKTFGVADERNFRRMTLLCDDLGHDAELVVAYLRLWMTSIAKYAGKKHAWDEQQAELLTEIKVHPLLAPFWPKAVEVMAMSVRPKDDKKDKAAKPPSTRARPTDFWQRPAPQQAPIRYIETCVNPMEDNRGISTSQLRELLTPSPPQQRRRFVDLMGARGNGAPQGKGDGCTRDHCTGLSHEPEKCWKRYPGLADDWYAAKRLREATR